MSDETIEEILECYGLDRILEDNLLTLVQVLSILNDLGYITLEEYAND